MSDHQLFSGADIPIQTSPLGEVGGGKLGGGRTKCRTRTTPYRNLVQSLYFLPTILVKGFIYMCLSIEGRSISRSSSPEFNFFFRTPSGCLFVPVCLHIYRYFVYMQLSRTFSTVLSVAGFCEETRFLPILPHEIVKPLDEEKLIMA